MRCVHLSIRPTTTSGCPFRIHLPAWKKKFSVSMKNSANGHLEIWVMGLVKMDGLWIGGRGLDENEVSFFINHLRWTQITKKLFKVLLFKILFTLRKWWKELSFNIVRSNEIQNKRKFYFHENHQAVNHFVEWEACFAIIWSTLVTRTHTHLKHWVLMMSI
jgi:hypothetical protein